MQQAIQLLTEALSWQNTPYHHAANIKGVGVDCVMFLVEVFKTCQRLPVTFDPRPYAPDWHLHQGAELYVLGLQQWADPVEQPQPGDVAVFQFGRCISHAALVLDWPQVLHAYAHDGFVVQSDINKSELLSKRLRGFYRVKQSMKANKQ